MQAAPEKQGDFVSIAVIGDLHDHWNDFDLAFLNASDYDLVFFVGDLGRGDAASRRISKSIAQLERPTLVMPGNADAPHGSRLAAEFSVRRGVHQLLGDASPAGNLGAEGVRLCGYSLHRPGLAGCDFTIVAGRPYSMGGPELSFAPEVHGRFGLDSMEGSAERLCSLVDQAETEALIFLAHNGPHGLGDSPADIWGCDFLPEPADWGDPDLELAIQHAKQKGHVVLAVVAGHMHLVTRGSGAERAWLRREEGTLYVNPARVPRIANREGAEAHHHVALRVAPERAEAEEIFVPA